LQIKLAGGRAGRQAGGQASTSTLPHSSALFAVQRLSAFLWTGSRVNKGTDLDSS